MHFPGVTMHSAHICKGFQKNLYHNKLLKVGMKPVVKKGHKNRIFYNIWTDGTKSLEKALWVAMGFIKSLIKPTAIELVIMKK